MFKMTSLATVLSALFITTNFSAAAGFFGPANCPGGQCPAYMGYGAYSAPYATTYTQPYVGSYAAPYTTNFAPTQGYGAPGCVSGQCNLACPNGQCNTGNCVNGNCLNANCVNGNCSLGSFSNGAFYGSSANCTCPTGNCVIHGQTPMYQGQPIYGAPVNSPVNSVPYGVQYRGSFSQPVPMQNQSPYSVGADSSPYYSSPPSTVDVRSNPVNLGLPAFPAAAPGLNRDRLNTPVPQYPQGYGNYAQPVSAPTFDAGSYSFH